MSLAYRLKSSYHNPMAVKRKQKSASLGCLFWIAFILLVLVLFFFNRKNIGMVLEKTGAMELITRKEHPLDGAASPSEPEIPAITSAKDVPTEPAIAEPTPAKPVKEKPKPAAPEAKKPAQETTKTTVAVTEKQTSKQTQKKPAPQTTQTTLFFVSIDSDGRVLRHEISRQIEKSASPLSDTLNALFSGTTNEESSKKLRSLVPVGTRLLSASVKDGVATLNLSEEFQFNQYGIEGYLGQLAQIVFTATAFPTVSSVQILIDGQRREYLGAEGVWIGTPLSRDKF